MLSGRAVIAGKKAVIARLKGRRSTCAERVTNAANAADARVKKWEEITHSPIALLSTASLGAQHVSGGVSAKVKLAKPDKRPACCLKVADLSPLPAPYERSQKPIAAAGDEGWKLFAKKCFLEALLSRGASGALARSAPGRDRRALVGLPHDQNGAPFKHGKTCFNADILHWLHVEERVKRKSAWSKGALGTIAARGCKSGVGLSRRHSAEEIAQNQEGVVVCGAGGSGKAADADCSNDSKGKAGCCMAHQQLQSNKQSQALSDVSGREAVASLCRPSSQSDEKSECLALTSLEGSLHAKPSAAAQKERMESAQCAGDLERATPLDRACFQQRLVPIDYDEDKLEKARRFHADGSLSAEEVLAMAAASDDFADAKRPWRVNNALQRDKRFMRKSAVAEQIEGVAISGCTSGWGAVELKAWSGKAEVQSKEAQEGEDLVDLMEKAELNESHSNDMSADEGSDNKVTDASSTNEERAPSKEAFLLPAVAAGDIVDHAPKVAIASDAQGLGCGTNDDDGRAQAFPADKLASVGAPLCAHCFSSPARAESPTAGRLMRSTLAKCVSTCGSTVTSYGDLCQRLSADWLAESNDGAHELAGLMRSAALSEVLAHPRLWEGCAALQSPPCDPANDAHWECQAACPENKDGFCELIESLIEARNVSAADLKSDQRMTELSNVDHVQKVICDLSGFLERLVAEAMGIEISNRRAHVIEKATAWFFNEAGTGSCMVF